VAAVSEYNPDFEVGLSGWGEHPEPTLTEFLLARIADDEAWVTDHFAGVTLGILPPGAPRIVPIPGSMDRVLAECEAKRRIIEGIPAPMVIHGGVGAPTSEPGILRLLALPYANHPDYRAEWRP
jgi:hypothetical protein